MKKLLAITALSAALFFGQTAAAEEKAAEEVKPSHVEMVLVLDESGSMSDLTRDTIGGFNSMIEKEKKLDVDAHVTTVLFNDQYKMLYNRRELKDVRKMTDKDYTPGGMTALLDAVGRTIHKMDMVAGIHRKDKGNKVLFVIITDGEENDSKEYTYADVRSSLRTGRKMRAGNLFSSARISMPQRKRKTWGSTETARSNIKIRAAVSAPTSWQWQNCRTLLPSQAECRMNGNHR